MPCCFCFMCPLAVAIAFGVCSVKALSVSPGRSTHCSLIAVRSVVSVGEKSAAWWKLTRLAGDADVVVMLLAWCLLTLLVLRFQSVFVWGVRVPCRIVSPINWISHVPVVNFASQPASQSLLMETKDVGPREGKRWASVAVAGRLGKLRFAVWVDLIVVPSGSSTAIGVVASRMLMIGSSVVLIVMKSVVKKWPVLPVSAMIGCVGGPIVVSFGNGVILLMLSLRSCFFVGSRPFHSFCSVEG